MTKRLWDCLTPEGKENLIKKARELGMLSFNPDDGRREPVVKVEGNLEDIGEIGTLMAMTPARFKEVEVDH